MKVYYADQEPPSVSGGIFLAGPTPRSADVNSWRPQAIKALQGLGFEGSVFVPEQSDGEWKNSYIDQIEWEERCLSIASVIAFWVPRDIKNGMPAFTTNDEWGFWKSSGKVVWGSPNGADKVRYQLYYAEKYGVPISDTLEGTMKNAIDLTHK